MQTFLPVADFADSARLLDSPRLGKQRVETLQILRAIELPDDLLDGFVMVGCLACGDGPLKPDVVFFGETVPRDRVEHCFGLVEAAGSLLVLGSSLTVMSGYRFVLRAAKLGIPVAIVNAGPTRGDAKADVRIDAPLGVVLPELARRLAG